METGLKWMELAGRIRTEKDGDGFIIELRRVEKEPIMLVFLTQRCSLIFTWPLYVYIDLQRLIPG